MTDVSEGIICVLFVITGDGDGDGNVMVVMI